MLEFFRKLFDSDYMPHGHCYFWQPGMVSLQVSSDTFIALSYFLIPSSLVRLVRKRRDLEFHWMFVMFGIFILSCGLTHVLSVYNVWHSAYRLDGFVKAITAVSSVMTAVLLFPLVPKALALPSPAMLQKEIEVRKGAEAEVRRLNTDLEGRVQERTATLTRTNEALQRFAYIASHDLQEPIRTIRSFNQLLARDYSGRLDPKADQYIHYVVDAAGRMQELVADLMAYARVLDQDAPRNRQTVDPASILSTVIENLRSSIEESQAVITWDDHMPLVEGDKTQIQQVFLNLLSNAIKYKREEEKPNIDIRWQNLEGYCEFAVEDNGIGIADGYFDQIFVAFKRLHGKEYPGSGVGLTICRDIVKEHGGRIWVESELGRGTTFFFTLPRAEHSA
jgi:signal transduction histidine kinase